MQNQEVVVVEKQYRANDGKVYNRGVLLAADRPIGISFPSVQSAKAFLVRQGKRFRTVR